MLSTEPTLSTERGDPVLSRLLLRVYTAPSMESRAICSAVGGRCGFRNIDAFRCRLLHASRTIESSTHGKVIERRRGLHAAGAAARQ